MRPRLPPLLSGAFQLVMVAFWLTIAHLEYQRTGEVMYGHAMLLGTVLGYAFAAAAFGIHELLIGQWQFWTGLWRARRHRVDEANPRADRRLAGLARRERKWLRGPASRRGRRP